MLYTLNLDNENYVLSVAHTKNDNVELDLTKIELQYLNAYQFINNKLVLDKEKRAEIIKEEEERKRQEELPTFEEKIEAQVLYTALMTDTLLESEEE